MAAINKYRPTQDPQKDAMIQMEAERVKHQMHLNLLTTLSSLMNPHTSSEFNLQIENMLLGLTQGFKIQPDEITKRESSN